MIYRTLVRPLLFRSHRGDAESVHEQTLRLLTAVGRQRLVLKSISRVCAVEHPSLERELFGLRFRNPIGLAAGMDKNAVALPAWAALGFGHVEVGTVTLQPQSGNPRPRLFRIASHDALINRMGFNNDGAAALARQLAVTPALPLQIGVSIGKSRAASLEQAVDDYLGSLRLVWPHAAYLAVNVSSPNTPGLRSLQDGDSLRELLAALQAENRRIGTAAGSPPRPLLVKVAPDLTDSALAELLQVCTDHAVAGIIATNTTIARDGLSGVDAALAGQAGGLSGVPLRRRAREVVRFISTHSTLPVIGVGGISTADDAAAMFEAGAALIQLYSGLVFAGPLLIRRLLRHLLQQPARQLPQEGERV
jgi:dihydroorotate dehydrogenase